MDGYSKINFDEAKDRIVNIIKAAYQQGVKDANDGTLAFEDGIESDSREELYAIFRQAEIESITIGCMVCHNPSGVLHKVMAVIPGTQQVIFFGAPQKIVKMSECSRIML